MRRARMHCAAKLLLVSCGLCKAPHKGRQHTSKDASTDDDATLPHIQFPKTRMNALPRWLEPTLAAAPLINSQTYAQDHGTVDVDESAVSQYKIFDRPSMLEEWKKIAVTRNAKHVKHMLDALIVSLLPHISLNGASLTLDDIFFMSFSIEPGAYFPPIHWDYEWSGYPGAAGFQLWYLVRPPGKMLRNSGGNMFLVDTPELKSHDLPAHWEVGEDGTVRKVLWASGMPAKAYSTVEEAGLGFRYLNMSAGEVLVFSRRTLHLSDPRPIWHGLAADGGEIRRQAMHVRIALRPPGWGANRTLPFGPGHGWWKRKGYTKPGPTQVANAGKQLGRHMGYDQVPVDRFTMLNFQ